LSVRGSASPKLFVVDDEEAIAELLSHYLRVAQFDVQTFYDARSALLSTRDGPPDILVSDIVMPGMDGVALARAVREQNPNCNVILISANPDWTRGISHCEGLDCFTLLPKPFPLSQLLSLIELGQVGQGEAISRR
jgi:DNA-binding NtrC family response regulator